MTDGTRMDGFTPAKMHAHIHTHTHTHARTNTTLGLKFSTL